MHVTLRAISSIKRQIQKSNGMKRFILAVLFLVAVVCSQKVFAQNDIVIGGGSDIGAILCEGKVYTWGRGTLKPTEVAFPVGSGTIKQVSAGSGSHFLALDCNGKVYSWGVNDEGQLGNGTIADQATPVLVKGVGGVGDLTNVASVAGGTNTSFAILNTGEIVSWGKNNLGQLGSGAIAPARETTPVYVKSAPGVNLVGASQVLAGDAATYALLKDGSVVSWGSTGYDYETSKVVGWGLLGRNLNGTPGNPGATLEVGSDPFARSVYINATTKLGGITNIGAGDVFALALAGDGHVYAWGHDQWGGTTGTSNCAAPGTGNGSDFTNPKLVTAGAAKNTKADDGGGYLLASSIAAGRGFGMAVTIDNKPVAWGNNGCTDAKGGCLGTGTVAQSCYPQYVRSGATTHADVVSITRGDTWGYYIRQDGSIYAFGANEGGKLGINSTDNQTSAVAFTSPCNVHIKPSAKISPRDTTVCVGPGLSIKLDAGFKINAALQAKYKIAWYKNDVLESGYPDWISVKGLNYTVKDSGEYKVRIYYDGSNKPCGEKDAVDSIKIIPLKAPLDTVNGYYCGTKGTFTIKSKYAAGVGHFAWYKTATGGTAIKNGITKVTGQKIEFTTDLTNATSNGAVPPIYSLFVEDSTNRKFSVLKTPCSPPTNASGQVKQYQSGLAIYKTSVLDTVSLYANLDNPGGGPLSPQLKISVYGGKKKEGKDVADPTDVKFTKTVDITIPVTATYASPGIIKLPVNFKLTGTSGGSQYWIEITPAGSESGYQLRAINHCNSSFPYPDDMADAKAAELIGVSQGGGPDPQSNLGGLFNFSFSKFTDYTCNRFEVRVFEKCPPCNRPKSTTLTTSPQPLKACVGETGVKLNGVYDDSLKVNVGTTATDSSMYFAWYNKKLKKQPAPADYKPFKYTDYSATSATFFGNTLSSPITIADSGVWVLRVQHGKNPIVSSCYREDSMLVIVRGIPAKLKAIDTSFCQFAPNAKFNIKPTTNSDTILWFKYEATAIQKKDTLVPKITTLPTAGYGTFQYKVRQISFGCLGDTSTLRATINRKPAKTTFTGDTLLCTGEKLEVQAVAGAGAGVMPPITKFIWAPKAATDTTAANDLNAVLSKAAVAKTDAGKYKVIAVSDKGCRDTTEVEVKVNDTPKASLSLVEEKFCNNGIDTASVKITINPATTSKYTVVIARSTQADTSIVMKATDTTFITRKGQDFTIKSLEDGSGCKAVAADIAGKVTTIAIPKPVAEILNPSSSPKVISDTKFDGIEGKDPGSNYTGTWSKTNSGSEQGTLSAQANNKVDLTGLNQTEEDGVGKGTTELSWTIKDNNNQCPDTVLKTKIVRKKITQPDAGRDTTVCGTYAAFKRKGNGDKALPAPTEKYKWIFDAGTAKINQLDSNEIEILPNLSVGEHLFIFNIINTLGAGSDLRDTFKLTVIEPPKANITTPGLPAPKTASINPDSIQLAADPLTGDYIGKWSIKDGQGQIDETTGKLKKLTDFEEPSSPGKGTTNVYWTVQDKGKYCPAVKDSATIIRVNVTLPKAGKDDTVCTNYAAFTRAGNGDKALASPIEEYKWIIPNPASGTIDPANKNLLNVPANLLPGTYTYIFNIKNTIANKDLNDTFLLHVIEPPVAEIIDPITITSTFASPASDDYTFNDTIFSIKATPPKKDYVGAWKATAPGVIRGNTADATNSLAGLAYEEKTTLTWTVKDKDSICPAAVATLRLTRKNITQPKVDDDSLCYVAGDSYALEGNGLITNEKAFWEYVGSDPVIPTVPIVTLEKADSTSTKATVSNIVLPANIGKVVLKFQYSVKSKLGATTPDIAHITLWEKTEIAQLSPSDTITCSDPFALEAPPLKQATATGEWKKYKGQGLVAITGNQIELSKLTNTGDTTRLSWTITNGLCGSTLDSIRVIKTGPITKPVITVAGGKAYPAGKEKVINLSGTVDSLCANSSFTVTGNDFVAAAPRNETGRWKYASGDFKMPDADTLNKVQTIDKTKYPTLKENDVAVWYWIINSDIPSCAPETTAVTLRIRDVPTQPTITGPPTVCEGSDTTFKALGSISGLQPVVYNWSLGKPGASRTGLEQGDSTKYKFVSDAAGTIVEGTFKVEPSNFCGIGDSAIKKVAIELAPRSFSVGNDTIHGPKAFCATNLGVGYYLDYPEAAGIQQVWTWSKGPVVLDHDTAKLTGWDQTADSFENIITVELRNKCSASAIAKGGILPVIKRDTFDIVAPKPIMVNLRTDKLLNKFCEPEDDITFIAKPDTKLNPFIATYDFYIGKPGGGKVAEFSTGSDNGSGEYVYTYDYSDATIHDKDVIYVVLNADPTQCITTFSAVDSVVMDGYNYPPAIIRPTALKICENQEIRLQADIDSKNTGKIEWYKDGIHLKQYSGSTGFPLNSPFESGEYEVHVKPTVCVDSSFSDTVTTVKIYELPRAHFTTDRMVVEYVDGIKAPMPLVIEKPINGDFIIESKYEPSEWLSSDDTTAVFVPKKEEREIEYKLTVNTGDSLGTLRCPLELHVKVLNFLPFRVPNAFSPNGDGLNEEWVIEGLGKYPNTSVKVFNRWGSSMFVDNDGYRARWDGTHNGVPLPAATYYYVIELKGSPDNTDRAETGSLTIIR